MYTAATTFKCTVLCHEVHHVTVQHLKKFSNIYSWEEHSNCNLFWGMVGASVCTVRPQTKKVSSG